MHAVSQSVTRMSRAGTPTRRAVPAWFTGVVLCLPAFAIVFGLLLYPLGFDLWLSLTGAANFQGSGSFVGLANYRELLTDLSFWNAARNTVLMIVPTAAVELVVGVLTALLLWWRFWGRSIVFLAVFVPWAVPSSLAAFSWFWLLLPPFHTFYTQQAIQAKEWFNGIFGLGAWDVVSLAVMNVWRGSSIIAIFLLAGLNAIPDELLDYGRLEARSVWRYLWHVVLPLNRRITVLAVAVALTITYLDFVAMYSETGGEATVPVIGTLSYLALILGGETGYSAALSVTQLPVAFVLAIVVLHFVEREPPTRMPATIDGWKMSGVRLTGSLPAAAASGAGSGTGGIAPSSPRPSGRPWHRRHVRRAGLAAGLIAALAVFSFHIFPVYYTAIQAVRRVTEYPLGMPFWAFHPDWGPVVQEIQDPVLLLWLRNTLVVFGSVLLIGLSCSLMAGYALARFRPPGARWLARLMFCLYFVPQMAVILPLYHIYAAVGLDNTLTGMILAYLTMAVPFSTWLFYSYFLGLDHDVEEHAWLDGGRLRVFVHIVLPMAWPIVIAAALFNVGIMGSDILYGSLFSLTNSTKTITVGLGISSLDLGEWGSASAGIIISALPFIVACAALGRYFVHGLRASLVEGA